MTIHRVQLQLLDMAIFEKLIAFGDSFARREHFFRRLGGSLSSLSLDDGLERSHHEMLVKGAKSDSGQPLQTRRPLGGVFCRKSWQTSISISFARQ